MKHIVIVYGASSAVLYVEEALNRGLKPIIVHPPVAYDPQELNFKQAVGDKAIYIDAKSMDDLSDVIAQLKKYDIACIVPGAAGGVVYAEKLIDAMGFEGNGFDTLYKRDTKKGMQDALKEAGIRYIKSDVVTSEDDIRKFFKDNDAKKVFMKFSESASTFGAKMCASVDEAIEHYRKISKMNNAYGWKSDVLIQEFIEGEEYIVNTCSCDGKHLVTDIWKYRKVLTKDNEMIYDSNELLMSVEPGMHDLIIYAYKVLDATGFKIGPCHGEFKIDEKGPVLIETNPRPMGASMIARYLDEALGHHITDIALDAYLDKARFMGRLKVPYRPKKKAIMKFVISPKDMDANLAPFMEILHGLKSFRYINPTIENKTVHVTKTIDLETSPAIIKLCHEDPNVVRREADFLHTLETLYVDLLLCTDDVIPPVEPKDYEWIKDYIPSTHKVLLVTNEGRIVYSGGKMTEVPINSWDTYDGIVIQKTTGEQLMEILKSMRFLLSQVHSGGYVVIVPEVFQKFPYGSAGLEILLSNLDCKVEVPPMESVGSIIAIKN